MKGFFSLSIVLLFSVASFASIEHCEPSGTLSADQPGTVLCDVSGPQGEENFLACVPLAPNGSGKVTFGPVSLKSYPGFDLAIVTSAVDNGATVTSALRISDSVGLQLATAFTNQSASLWINDLRGHTFSANCRPYRKFEFGN